MAFARDTSTGPASGTYASIKFFQRQSGVTSLPGPQCAPLHPKPRPIHPGPWPWIFFQRVLIAQFQGVPSRPPGTFRRHTTNTNRNCLAVNRNLTELAQHLLDISKVYELVSEPSCSSIHFFESGDPVEANDPHTAQYKIFGSNLIDSQMQLDSI